MSLQRHFNVILISFSYYLIPYAIWKCINQEIKIVRRYSYAKTMYDPILYFKLYNDIHNNFTRCFVQNL